LLDYFPDKFLTWGEFWNDLIDLPISRENVISVGFPYFHYKRQACRSVVRRKNCILVLSQGTIGRSLAERLAVDIDELDGFELVYKLHPSEVECWREYPAMREFEQRRNVRIVDRNDDLYRLFAEAEFQIGVYSTAIYEGIGMGCKTVLVDLPGVEYMEKLVTDGLAVLHRQGSSIADNLQAVGTIDARTRSEEMFGYSSEEILCAF
jgi:hypothetical protein